MSKFGNFIKRVRVVLNAAPLYLVGASTIITVSAEEISKAFPGVAGPIAHYSAVVLGALAAVIAIIRRVSPVPAEARGLLVPEAETVTLKTTTRSDETETETKTTEAIVVPIPDERIKE